MFSFSFFLKGYEILCFTSNTFFIVLFPAVGIKAIKRILFSLLVSSQVFTGGPGKVFSGFSLRSLVPLLNCCTLLKTGGGVTVNQTVF